MRPTTDLLLHKVLGGLVYPEHNNSNAEMYNIGYLHVLHLEDAKLLLHLTDVAGGFGHVGSLLVPLGQQLLDVLLLLLQGFLERGGARDLTGVARRCLSQLKNKKDIKH